MNRLALLAVAILSAGISFQSVAPAEASAQVAPADSAAVLLEAARSFADEGNHDVARALYRYVIERFPGSAAAGTARVALAGAPRGSAGSGATELQVWSTMYGLFLGVAIPGALGVDDSEPYGLGLLLGGPAGFITGRTVARRTDISVGQARAVTLGGTWGAWQGFGWREVLDIEAGLHCDIDYCSGSDGEETFAAMVIGSAVGVTTGALLARRPISDGTAAGANFGALWGSWAGVAVGVLADLEDDALLAATLIGGNAGLASLAFAADDMGWSRNRWRVVSIAGVLGGLGGLGIDLLVQPDDEKVAVAIPLVTSLVGIGLGIRTTRNDPGAYENPDTGVGGLFGYRDGGFRMGEPVLAPTLLPLDGPRGTEWKPALGVTLFRAVF